MVRKKKKLARKKDNRTGQAKCDGGDKREVVKLDERMSKERMNQCRNRKGESKKENERPQKRGQPNKNVVEVLREILEKIILAFPTYCLPLWKEYRKKKEEKQDNDGDCKIKAYGLTNKQRG